MKSPKPAEIPPQCGGWPVRVETRNGKRADCNCIVREQRSGPDALHTCCPLPSDAPWPAPDVALSLRKHRANSVWQQYYQYHTVLLGAGP